MGKQSHIRKIYLASSSPYRKQLLQRLQIDFEVQAPEVDESPLENERPVDLVRRLASRKAGVISALHPSAVVIGSDQVAVFEHQIIGKPGTRDRALQQLGKFSGHSIEFITAVSVQCPDAGFSSDQVITSEAKFRVLSRQETERYLEMDDPLDCAGGFKSEAAGSSLLEYLRSDDPTAIIGLPLITVAALLRECGFQIP
jgi:septum formation protein